MNAPQFLKIWQTGADSAEQALIRAAQRGHRASFDALSRTHTPLLRGFLTRRVGPNAAEDVLQDTLLAAWTGLPQYRGRARFKSWLYAIASRKCADWYRQRGRIGAEVPLDEAAELPDNWTEDAASSERKQILRDAMSLLPDAQREVLELYYDAELTLAEVGLALDRKVNTVKYQFYRAHALVEKELAKNDWNDAQKERPAETPRQNTKQMERKGPAVR